MQTTRTYPRHSAATLEVRETTSPPSEAHAAQDPSAVALAEARQAAARMREENARILSERDDFERRLSEREADLAKAKVAVLPPDQQYAARLAEMEANQRRIQEQAQEQSQALLGRIRGGELALYRSTAIREAITQGHGFLESLVGGSSEEEIDASLEVARAEYARVEAQVAAKMQAQYQAQWAASQAAQPPAMVVQQQVPVYQAPPPNPAYPAQQPQGGGYPTAPAAFQPVPMADGTIGISEMTTEEAVRTGKYSGAVREQLMRQMKMGSGAPPGPLGVQPRQMGAMTYQQMPNGVMQPQGLPTPQVVPPQYQQQYVQGPPPAYQQPQVPQYQGPPQAPQFFVPQVPPQQGGDAALRAQALAAVARTHAGQNPAMGDPSNAGAAEASAASRAYAQANGINGAQAAFQTRFNPTPPMPQN